MKNTLLPFIICLLFIAGCKKEEPAPPQTSSPYKFKGVLNGAEWNASAKAKIIGNSITVEATNGNKIILQLSENITGVHALGTSVDYALFIDAVTKDTFSTNYIPGTSGSVMLSSIDFSRNELRGTFNFSAARKSGMSVIKTASGEFVVEFIKNTRIVDGSQNSSYGVRSGDRIWLRNSYDNTNWIFSDILLSEKPEVGSFKIPYPYFAYLNWIQGATQLDYEVISGDINLTEINLSKNIIKGTYSMTGVRNKYDEIIIRNGVVDIKEIR